VTTHMAETPDEPREMPPKPQRIISDRFIKALLDEGIVQFGEHARRVVIDAEAGQVSRIYVERLGDDRLLKVATTLQGIEISRVPA
jgi:hypothetical protein